MFAPDRRPGLIRLYTACALATLGVLLPFAYLQAQTSDLRLPISLDADSTDYDGKNSMLMFRGLKLTQGNIGIVADEGRASKLDFEDSVWQFSGNVVIDTENGQVQCETADLKFSGHQLRRATITGSPATFETQRKDSKESTVAQARQLTYDFIAGSIEFSGNAIISEGGNKITSEFLVYNIAEQRIKAQSGGDVGRRVTITYTPTDNEESADDGAVPETPESGENPDAAPDDGIPDTLPEGEIANESPGTSNTP